MVFIDVIISFVKHKSAQPSVLCSNNLLLFFDRMGNAMSCVPPPKECPPNYVLRLNERPAPSKSSTPNALIIEGSGIEIRLTAR